MQRFPDHRYKKNLPTYMTQEPKCEGCKECLESPNTTGEQCVTMRECLCHQPHPEPWISVEGALLDLLANEITFDQCMDKIRSYVSNEEVV